MNFLEKAQSLEAAEPVSSRRHLFHIPTGSDGEEIVYFCGNSLGLMPKAVEGLSLIHI